MWDAAGSVIKPSVGSWVMETGNDRRTSGTASIMVAAKASTAMESASMESSA